MAVFRLIIALLFLTYGCAQNSIEETLGKLNNGSVPYISAAELAGAGEVVILDTRSGEEFKVSHLQHALWVGYGDFSPDSLARQIPDKSTPVVVYCSVGVRSEDIGEKLIEQGYGDVKNLYGGIFEWKNKGYPVFDSSGMETEKVHAYNKQWGELLKSGEKVY
jgi:rhodanese-related sulfurtransferase